MFLTSTFASRCGLKINECGRKIRYTRFWWLWYGSWLVKLRWRSQWPTIKNVFYNLACFRKLSETYCLNLGFWAVCPILPPLGLGCRADKMSNTWSELADIYIFPLKKLFTGLCFQIILLSHGYRGWFFTRHSSFAQKTWSRMRPLCIHFFKKWLTIAIIRETRKNVVNNVSIYHVCSIACKVKFK